MSNILDDIDAAIDDWEHGQDAARWAPRGTETVVGSGEGWRIIREDFGACISYYIEIDAEAFDRAASSVTPWW